MTLNDAVTDVRTRNPPATLTSLPTGLVRYEFDAAEFDIILNQGTVVATGIVTDTVDLAAEPVSGAADPRHRWPNHVARHSNRGIDHRD